MSKPDMQIALKNGITADVILTPMPKPVADGSYPKFYGAARQPQIALTFRKDGRVIAPKVPWNVVIAGKDSVAVAPGVVLDADDLHTIDSDGWGLMSGVGMFPTAFVG